MGILDFLYPRQCFECGKHGKYICALCLRKVANSRPFCFVCRKPSVDFTTHPRCKTKLGIDRCVAVFAYEGVIRKALLKLKYSFYFEIAQEISEVTLSKLSDYPMPQKAVLIPVPLFLKREKWRGFNQTEIMGTKIAKHFGWKYSKYVLKRVSFYGSQSGLNRKERKKNIVGAFVFNSAYKGKIKEAIVFDDKLTSGATLSEITKVLKRNGVEKVTGLVVCK